MKAFIVLSLLAVLLPSPVRAQQPLCPAPTPEETYFTYCSPWAEKVVASFLYDLSVSQLFKSSEGLELPTARLLDAMGLATLLFQTDEDRQKLLKERPTVEFRPLDRLGAELAGRGYSSTGEFISKSSAGAQTLRSSDPITGAGVEIDLPEIIQGTYWRSPAHLELQFYAGHGVRFRLATGGGKFEQAVQCVSVSRSQARATTTDKEGRFLLARFGDCK